VEADILPAQVVRHDEHNVRFFSTALAGGIAPQNVNALRSPELRTSSMDPVFITVVYRN
jgi:hypothetical protein